MASERGKLRQPGGAGRSGTEATTQSDEEWPVPDLYAVEPDPKLAENGPEQAMDAKRGTLVVSEPRRRRGRRGLIAGSLAAVVLLLLLTGAVAAVALRDAESAATSPPPAGFESSPATTSTSQTTPSATTETSTPSTVARTKIPDVVGLDVANAKDELRAAGLRHEVRLMRAEKPTGTVLGQQPAAGTKADPESVVRLEVSRGVPKVEVPSLVGSWSSVAERRLRQLGLRWTSSELASAKPKGQVIGQSPSGGAQVEKGQAVTLEISTGPAGVAVPDVTGLDEPSARQELEAAGFQVRVRSEPTSDPGQDGIVTGQSPTSGVEAKEGSTVTLTVGRSS